MGGPNHFQALDNQYKYVTPYDNLSMIAASSNSLMSPGFLSGFSDAIVTGVTYNTISNVADAAFDYDAVLGKLNIVSASANDTTAGTGIQTLIINGLNEDFDEITEIVSLLGTTAVQSTNNFQRVNSTLVLASGALRGAGGDITCSSVDFPGSIHFKIMATQNASHIGRVCTPRGKTYIFGNFTASLGNGDEVVIKAYFHNAGVPLQDVSEIIAFQNAFTVASNLPTPLGEKTDLIYMARSTKGSSSSATINVPYWGIKTSDIL
jgi:hypothetical protein